MQSVLALLGGLLGNDLIFDLRIRRFRDDLLRDEFVLGLVGSTRNDLRGIRLANPLRATVLSAAGD